jgi:hypothetical protein
MNDDDKKHKDQFDASLELPVDPVPSGSNKNPAADLIRKRVEAAYTHEPDAEDEAEEAEETPKSKRSKHQQFMLELTNSGRPLHEINTAWHEYYAGLTDTEKHEVWQEFYSGHAQAAHHPAISHTKPKPEPIKALARRPVTSHSKKISKTPKTRAKKSAVAADLRSKPASPFHSLLFGLGIGSITLLIFLFGFFNERIIAPFIQPSRTITNIPIITTGGDGHVTSAAPEIIIPKINVEVPVVYGVTSTDDSVVKRSTTVTRSLGRNMIVSGTTFGVNLLIVWQAVDHLGVHYGRYAAGCYGILINPVMFHVRDRVVFAEYDFGEFREIAAIRCKMEMDRAVALSRQLLMKTGGM